MDIKEIEKLPNKIVPIKELCFDIAQRENWIPIGKYGNRIKHLYELELGTDGEFRYSYRLNEEPVKVTLVEV